MGEYDRGNLFVFAVTPCVGVWIEMGRIGRLFGTVLKLFLKTHGMELWRNSKL